MTALVTWFLIVMSTATPAGGFSAGPFQTLEACLVAKKFVDGMPYRIEAVCVAGR